MVGRDILIAPKMRRTKDSPPYQQHPKGFGQHALNNKKMFLIAVFTAIMLVIGQSAYAGTVTWDGSASAVWTNGDNWIDGVAPATNDDVVIDGNYTNAPILNLSGGAVTINSLDRKSVV